MQKWDDMAQGFFEQRSVGMGPAAGVNLLSGPRARPRLPRAWVSQVKRPRVQQSVVRIRPFGTGELRQWVPVPGLRRSWAGVPKGKMGKKGKKVLCASLTFPSAKQGQQSTSQHTWHRYREVVYTSVHLVTSSMFTQDLHSYLCDHEATRGQSLPNCFILGGGDRLGKGILVHEISPQ